MSMLKYAYDLGFREAIKEAQLTPEQMQAAQITGGIGGGLAGATGGGLLGKYLGSQVGEALNRGHLFNRVDPEKAKLIGMGLGGLLGGGVGAVAGSQIPRMLKSTAEPEAQPEGDESALGALPIAYSDYDPYADYGYGYY
jgi:hypothetical protein